MRTRPKKHRPAPWTQVPGAKPAHGGIATIPLPNGKSLKVPVRIRCSRVRHISPHRRAENEEDGRRLALWWPTNVWCFLYPNEAATDRHHVFGKVGKLLLLVRLWVPLTRKGHNWVETHRPLARAIGLLCPEGRWNSTPTEAETEAMEYRQAVYKALCGVQPLLRPGPLVSPLQAGEIKREVIRAFAQVRATL